MPVVPVLTRHPISAMFPDLSDPEFQDLVDSIEETGVQVPIIVHRGRCIDGWNRYLAYRHLYGEESEADLREWGISLPVRELTDAEAEPFALAQLARAGNLQRRHLTLSQRASIAVRIGEWASEQPAGEASEEKPAPTSPATGKPMTTKEMAAEVGVSEATMHDARIAEEGGYGDAVRAGEISANAAAQKVKQERKEAEEARKRAEQVDSRPAAPAKPKPDGRLAPTRTAAWLRNNIARAKRSVEKLAGALAEAEQRVRDLEAELAGLEEDEGRA